MIHSEYANEKIRKTHSVMDDALGDALNGHDWSHLEEYARREFDAFWNELRKGGV